MASILLSSCSALALPSPSSASPSLALRSTFKGLSLSNFCRTLPAPLSFSPSSPLPIVAVKGYKIKTHHASAKRFRVTGAGRIICRRAGKQHLLWKKNTKRRNRLSKMALVEKADYENITHALPYLKVSKK